MKTRLELSMHTMAAAQRATPQLPMVLVVKRPTVVMHAPKSFSTRHSIVAALAMPPETARP
jgi:hypothetical protein